MRNYICTLFIATLTVFVPRSLFAQSISGAHKAAFFKDASGSKANIPANWLNYTSAQQTTMEAWVKLDTTLATYNYNLDATIADFHGPAGSSDRVLKVHVLHDSIFANHFGVRVGYPYPTYSAGVVDSGWHHIALITDTLTYGWPWYAVHDSISLFIDGNFVAKSHDAPHTLSGSIISSMYNVGYENTGGSSSTILNYWQGHLSRFVLYDTAIYATSFTPDCVFDTVGFFSGGTISQPADALIPLNGNDTTYSVSSGKVHNAAIVYSYLTSPCAPVYTYYAPTTAFDSAVIWAHNSNASYMKGAHAAPHVNGWTGAMTSITEGIFTDSLHVYASGVHPYYSDYYGDTIAHKSVTVTISTTGLLSTQQSNMLLYPNPSKGVVTINVAHPTNVIVEDITGKIIRQVYVRDTSTIADLSSGIYIVFANNQCFKLIVQ